MKARRDGLRMGLRGLLAGAAAAGALAVAGCLPGPTVQARNSGPLGVELYTEPDPPQVGRDAVARVRILRGEVEGVDGCEVRMRQYMPDHEMADDERWFRLMPRAEGRYDGRTGVFSMGGHWVLEVAFRCGRHADTLPFTLKVPWPH